MPYYFAYGSNMDFDQMKNRCSEATIVGVAVLPNYKIAFTRFSTNRDCAVADVVACEGSEVWGLVYDLTADALSKLDGHEGYPSSYNRMTKTVYLRQDKKAGEQNDSDISLDESSIDYESKYLAISAEIYYVVNKVDNLNTSSQYLTKLTDAAVKYKFPIKYQDELKSFGY
jgi:gamma-glutamylcyclotransferase (GGCT)/AIG2-like uncharacterized protein YtfP